MTPDRELVALATVPNQLEAELWQGVLAEHGIFALLDAAGVQSYLGLTTRPVRIMVRPWQRAEAEEILAALAEIPEDEASR
ncbi:MAG: DUF2007 domain-containing protein [Chloroflexi bacterium]|nr:DUF2007 domain-containing protein [Chloroflexota bacterium]